MPQPEVQAPICPCRFVDNLHTAYSYGCHTGGASSSRVRRSAPGRGAEPRARRAQKRCRRTRINEAGDAAPVSQDFHHAGSPHFTVDGYSSSNAAYSHSRSPATDFQFSETHSSGDHDNNGNNFAVLSAALTRRPTLEVQIHKHGGQHLLQESAAQHAELKKRLHLWVAGEIREFVGRILGQQHPGPLRRRKRNRAATN